MAMPQDPRTEITCPVGAEHCPTLEEVQRLQGECRELERQLQLDHLTHLFNVRYLFTALEHEMERTRRTGLPTALIMIDLDHFKQINDNFGHQTGNQVLQWVSKLWRETLRRIDIACRYGGEEFAMILPATRLTQAVRAAERLRAILESSSLKLKERTIRITASFGVDSYALREELTVDAFVQRVDRLLLEAKATGRNRVCHQTAEARREPTEISTEERAMLFVGRWPKA
jgi:two-component system cell cycle response regulator